MKRSLILFAFLLVPSFVFADDKEPPLPPSPEFHFWVAGGRGIHTVSDVKPFSSLEADASFLYKGNLFSARGFAADEEKWLRRSRIANNVREVSLLYGRGAHTTVDSPLLSAAILSLSAGVTAVQFENQALCKTEGKFTCKKQTFGGVVQLQNIYVPFKQFPYAGLGVQAYANVNAHQPWVGLSLKLAFGLLD